ncbi:MAG TPA: nucleotidyltransferase family protein [Allosphingosinicella sp.]|uniref:nucleotidyltransferase family protein n=1 Tax=Allosphingosinicella sp. TaxID=2823234 RepID=UPI002EDBAF8A
MKSGDNWTAIILAGQRPGENAFARSHGVEFKALIPVAGEPMLGRVVRTMLACPSVGRIVILAQEPEALLAGELGWIRAEPRIGTAAAGAGISDSIDAVAGSDAAPWPVLVVTADHALLTPEVVEHFLAQAGAGDGALAVVERKVVEAEFPETRRTWIKFRGGQFSGANLFALCGENARKALAIWSGVERDRKKALKLLRYFGPLLALRALTRTITIEGALLAVGRKAGLDIRAVRLPFAKAAIDVDKPADLELVERILRRG